MNRRFEQPQRDRFIQSRPRFNYRPNQRYMRQESGPYRIQTRYSPPPPHQQQQQEHRVQYKPHNNNHSANREHHRPGDQISFVRKHQVPKKEEKKKEVDIPVEKKTINQIEQVVEKEVKKEEIQPKVVAVEQKLEKKKVYKEAVVSFDSDSEDDDILLQQREEVEEVIVEKKSSNTEAKQVERDVSLPSPWKKHVTDKGETYFYNKITRESSWQVPTEKRTEISIEAEKKKEGNGSVSKSNDVRKSTVDHSSSDDINHSRKRKLSPSEQEPRKSTAISSTKSSLSSRISYLRSDQPAPVHHYRAEVSRRPLSPPPPLPRRHSNGLYHHSNSNNNRRFSPPPPPLPMDQYYPPPNGNRRMNDRYHHNNHHHHPADTAAASLPPRWVQNRRGDFGRQHPTSLQASFSQQPPHYRRDYR